MHAAIEAAAQYRPHRAVLDLKMPGKNGLEVLDELLKVSPDTKVVILTGYGSITNAVEAVKLGAVGYITKPADADLLSDLPDPAKMGPWLSEEDLQFYVEEFTRSIAENDAPGAHLSETLTSLWWDRKGDWDLAHRIAQEIPIVADTPGELIGIVKNRSVQRFRYVIADDGFRWEHEGACADEHGLPLDDLRFAAELGVDYIAASFVHGPEDVVAIRTILAQHGAADFDLDRAESALEKLVGLSQQLVRREL